MEMEAIVAPAGGSPTGKTTAEASVIRRLLLVPHASTAGTRLAAFSASEPLDRRGQADAARLSSALPRYNEVVVSPAVACRATAVAAELTGRVDHGIAECDYGAWAGLTLAEVAAREPDAVSSWLSDPQARPHGGETLASFIARVARWLEGQVGFAGTAVVITHAGVVKAALVHALGAPLASFWRIDAAPLTITELHGHGGRWTVTRSNCPILER